MFCFEGHIFRVESPSKNRDVILADLSRTAGGAETTHHTVKGELGQPLNVAPHGSGDVVHHLNLHRARLGASITLEASQELGVVLHQGLYVGLYLLNIIDTLGRREEGNLSEIHVRLDNGLTGQTHLDLISLGEAV